MQVTFNEQEMKAAMTRYIQQRLHLEADETITMEFVASRGETGFKAVVDITSADTMAVQQSTTSMIAQLTPPSKPKAEEPKAVPTVEVEQSNKSEVSESEPTKPVSRASTPLFGGLG